MPGMPQRACACIGALVLFVCGVLVPACVAQDPSVVGQWTPVQQFPYIAAHTHLLNDGRVLFWPTFSTGNNPQLWNPQTNTTVAATRAAYNIFCSGHVVLANGKVFVAGGHNGGSGYGYPYATVYDPATDSWSSLPNMNDARWYPTATKLPNGDVLVISGDIDPNTINTLPQVFSMSSGTWRNLTNAQLSVPLYPNMFVAPNGKVAYVGPQRTSKYLDTSGTGTWSTLATQIFPNGRDYGDYVMFDGKILAAGGYDPPTATAEVLDLNAATPTWQSTASMLNARRQANSTLLPDGKVLVTGGSSGSGFDDNTHPVYASEMWNPATGTWSTMASITIYRGYHSTAVLLPDGRVLSAGGEKTGATYEVYSPPYLFKGARPTITSAPSSVGYNPTFFVQTPDASRIASVTWIAPASTTHTNNMSQRLLHLGFSQANGGLNITSPADANLSPPGLYMLFLVDTNGIPSVAAFIQNAASASVPNAPSGLTATTISAGEIDLQWTDNSSNETGFAIERSLDGTSFTQVSTTASNVSTFADTSVSPSTSYFYRVKATGTSGDSAYSNVANASTGASNIPLVQRATVSGTSVASLSAAFPGANAGGNLPIAFVRASTTTPTITISDTLHNTYVEAVRQNQTSDGHQIRIYYAANSLAGANTVTASFSAANAHPMLAVFEYAGLSTSNPLDRTISAQGSGTLASTGTSTATGSANELLFAGTGLPSNSPAIVTPGTGYTLELQDSRKGFSRAATEDRLVTSTGSYGATFNLSGSAKWSAALATFSATPVASPLAVTTSSLPNGTVGTAYSTNLFASGGVQPYSWALASGSTLPAGLSLSTTGTISGTPTVSGTTNFNVTVTDSSSPAQTANKSLSITVASQSGTPPTITTTSLPNGTVGTAYSASLSATGGVVPYTWSLANGSTLPAGLSLGTDGTISGTPTVAGTTNFTVTVSDSGSPVQTANKALSITINAGSLAITTTSLPNGTVGTAYSTSLSASGGTPPYTWALASGSTLPAGLSLSASGVISGTPTATGTTNFTVTVSDSSNPAQTANKALSITINAASLAITTTSLPNGTVGTAYSTSLSASGGTPPYTWAPASGSTLPAGLSLSATGTISGTPTVSGTTNFTVNVSDSSTPAQTANKGLSITVDPAQTGTPITLVQSASVKGAAVTSVSQPFAAANATGNLIVAFVRMSTSTQTVQLSDTAGNTYTEAVGQVQSTDGHQIHIFYAKNIAGGANTVTATFSAANNYPWLAIYEYSGLSTSAPLDQVAAAQGSTATVSTALTPTTTSTNELVFSGVGLPASSSRTVTAGTGFTLLLQNNSAPSTSRAASEHQFSSSTGQFAGTFTLSGTANWSAVVATFKQ